MSLEVDIRLERGTHAFTTTSRHVGVFGPSGAGKTTLLHAIAGLLPTTGRIAIDGAVVVDSTRGLGAPPERRRVGVVFQDDRLFPHVTVRRNLTYGQPAQPRQSLDEVAQLLEIDALLDRRPHTLSGGEARRVAIARAVLAEPRLLLLDEPLVSLDSAQRAHVLALLDRLDHVLDIPTVHVSHDAAELARRAREIVLVDRGRTVAHGTIPELAADAEAWPRMRELGAVNALEAVVATHDAAAGLTRFDLPGGAALLGPLHADLAIGSKRMIAFGSHDVALSRAMLEGISIRNQIPARVRAIHRHADHSMVELDLGVIAVAEVSHQTVASMDLVPGTTVVCLIKSNAVRLT